MSEPTDMDRPITRRELEETLATRLGKLKAEIDHSLSKYPTKDDLRKSLEAWGHEVSKRLSGELAQHTKAILEAMRRDVAAVDDKYRDLPPRVKKLEAKVFAPKRRRTK